MKAHITLKGGLRVPMARLLMAQYWPLTEESAPDYFQRGERSYISFADGPMHSVQETPEELDALIEQAQGHGQTDCGPAAIAGGEDKI
jgi:hypothetical protein